MRKTVVLLMSVISSVAAFAALTISDVKVTPMSPWGMVVDYEVSGAISEDADNPLFLVIKNVGGGVVSKTLSGDVRCANGHHRVCWNMAKDGVSVDVDNVVVNVCYMLPYCVIDLSAGASATSYGVSYFSSLQSDGFTNGVYKETKLVMKRVNAGTFISGDDQTNEAHRVILTKPYYLGIFEVTQRQWELVMNSNPSKNLNPGDKVDTYVTSPRCPVERVSYNDIRGSSDGAKWPTSNAVDADTFLGKLRDRTNIEFDLPTAAQWEYACRAGTQTVYSYGDTADSEYMVCNASSTRAVGTRKGNDWGFYDMHGNVKEWCLDIWTSDSITSGRYGSRYGTDPTGSNQPYDGCYRVQRGGSYLTEAKECSSASYDLLKPQYGGDDSGFRLCRPCQPDLND